MPLPFIHLRNHCAYSLSEGAIRMGELVALAVKQEMPAVALTDSSNLFGALEFSQECYKKGIQPIIGCEIKLAVEADKPDEYAKCVVIAKDQAGYGHLLRLTSQAFIVSAGVHDPVVFLTDLLAQAEGLILLTGGTDGPLGLPIRGNRFTEAEALLERFKDTFGDRLYMELNRHKRPEDEQTEGIFLDMAYKHSIPLVATNNCLYPTKDLFEAQDALMCIATGRYMSESDRPRYTPEHYFKTQAQMRELFKDLPEAIENTALIARRCSVMSETAKPMLPHFPTEAGRSEDQEFEAVSKQGLEERLNEYVFPRELRAKQKQAPHTSPEEDCSHFSDQKNAKPGISLSMEEKAAIAAPYRERLAYEISVIEKMEFPGYFLIVSDFIRWSKANDIPVGPGRGSGAGSVVAWAMRITDLDPLQFGLLFERFLNPERVSMPDFDVDFCQDRREEVIRYVQDKYGSDHVAQIITFGKLQARAVVRDVGRILQMPYGQVDKICKMIPNNPAAPVTLQQAIDLDPELRKTRDSDEQIKHLLDLGLKLEGMYRHAGTHAAGIVIGSQPLDEMVPLYKDPRSPLPATQFSMKYAEMAGLVKFDFLGLKTLTLIQNAVRLVNQRQTCDGSQETLVIEHIPLDDPASFFMLAAGDATGVFQMESAGMRDALRKMKPDTLEDIIALISLYRPGPMENIPTYIARKHRREQPDYLHALLEPCLKETYGVIIYQEQVMEIAKVLAGYSLGEADLLRRAMGKKIKEEMDQQRARFMEGAKAKGVNAEKAGEIFDLVAKFAGYGFNKSHAAAYALIGYQTAYLKANFPVEFFTACMNMDSGDTDKLAVYVSEARNSGITVLPPDVNESDARFAVEKLPDGQLAIRYGLGALKGVGGTAMEVLANARRAAGGRFTSLTHFAESVDNRVAGKRQIEGLAKSGAFDSLHPNRHQIADQAQTITRFCQNIQEEKESQQNNLFGGADTASHQALMLKDLPAWDYGAQLEMERDAVGFYLSAHPLDSYADALARMGVIPAVRFMNDISSGEVLVAGVPTSLSIKVSHRGRFAYLGLSDATGKFEVSLFDERMLQEKRDLLEGNQPLFIRATARKDEGGVRLIAEHIEPLDDVLENRVSAVKLFLDHAAGIPALKAMLLPHDGGKSHVHVVLTTENAMQVEIRLPHRYRLPLSTLSELRRVQGVSAVLEGM